MKDILLKSPFVILMGTCIIIIGLGAYKQSNLIEMQLVSFENSHKSKIGFYEQLLEFNCNSKETLTSLMNSDKFYKLENPITSYLKLGNTLKEVYGQSLKIHPYSVETRNLANELQLILQNGVNASFELAELVSGSKTIKNEDIEVESIQYYNFFILLSSSALISKNHKKRFNDLTEILVDVSRKLEGFKGLTNSIKEDIVVDANMMIKKLERSFNNPLNNFLVSFKKKEIGLVRLKEILTVTRIYSDSQESMCNLKKLDFFRDELQLNSAYRMAVRLD